MEFSHSLVENEEFLTSQDNESIGDLISSFEDFPDIAYLNDLTLPNISDLGEFGADSSLPFYNTDFCNQQDCQINTTINHQCLESLLREEREIKLVGPAPQVPYIIRPPANCNPFDLKRSVNSELDKLLSHNYTSESFSLSSNEVIETSLINTQPPAAAPPPPLSQPSSSLDAERKLDLIRQLLGSGSDINFAISSLEEKKIFPPQSQSLSTTQPPCVAPAVVQRNTLILPSHSANQPTAVVNNNRGGNSGQLIQIVKAVCNSDKEDVVVSRGQVYNTMPQQQQQQQQPVTIASNAIRPLILKTNAPPPQQQQQQHQPSSVSHVSTAPPILPRTSNVHIESNAGRILQTTKSQQPMMNITTTTAPATTTMPVKNANVTSYSIHNSTAMNNNNATNIVHHPIVVPSNHHQQQQQHNHHHHSTSYSSSSSTVGGSGGGGNVPRGGRRSQHNVIEKRYRLSINDKIDELRHLLPDDDSKGNKSAVLRRAVEYIHSLESENRRLRNELRRCGPRQDSCHSHLPQHYRNSSEESEFPLVYGGDNGAIYSESSPSAHCSDPGSESPTALSITPKTLVQSPDFITKSSSSEYSFSSTNMKRTHPVDSLDQDELKDNSKSKISRLEQQQRQMNTNNNVNSRNTNGSIAARGFVMICAFTLLVFTPADYLLSSFGPVNPHHMPVSPSASSSRRILSWQVIGSGSETAQFPSAWHNLAFWLLLFVQWSLAGAIFYWLWFYKKSSTLREKRLENALNLWQCHFSEARLNLSQKQWKQAHSQLLACNIALNGTVDHPVIWLPWNILHTFGFLFIPKLFIRNKSEVQQQCVDALIQSECLRLQLITSKLVKEETVKSVYLWLRLKKMVYLSQAGCNSEFDDNVFNAIVCLFASVEVVCPFTFFVKPIKFVTWKSIQDSLNASFNFDQQSSWYWLKSSQLAQDFVRSLKMDSCPSLNGRILSFIMEEHSWCLVDKLRALFSVSTLHHCFQLILDRKSTETLLIINELESCFMSVSEESTDYEYNRLMMHWCGLLRRLLSMRVPNDQNQQKLSQKEKEEEDDFIENLESDALQLDSDLMILFSSMLKIHESFRLKQKFPIGKELLRQLVDEVVVLKNSIEKTLALQSLSQGKEEISQLELMVVAFTFEGLLCIHSILLDQLPSTIQAQQLTSVANLLDNFQDFVELHCLNRWRPTVSYFKKSICEQANTNPLKTKNLTRRYDSSVFEALEYMTFKDR